MLSLKSLFQLKSGLCQLGLLVGLASLLSAETPLKGAVPGTVAIGGERKVVFGTIVSMSNGDNACYLHLKDENGKPFDESADFSICAQEETILNKHVELHYEMKNIRSERCQGADECTTTKLVPLVTAVKFLDSIIGAASPSQALAETGQKSFCAQMETVVFTCLAGTKMVSVCSSKGASASTGTLEYRFGKADSHEPLEISLPDGVHLPKDTATGQCVPFAGGGGCWLRFQKGKFSYVVYTGIGKWGPDGETQEKEGLVVERDGKVLTNIKCTDRFESALGPDWFEQFGISVKDEEDFLFPD
jgi:hypothetical protein